MQVETTKIEGLLILHPNVFGDDRAGLWKALISNVLHKHLNN